MRKFEQRRRNKKNRSKNSFVIIGCEGINKTEKLYFKNFHSKKCIIKFAKGNSTDPKGIVQDIQSKQKQIEEAKKIAKEKGVEIITSTPTFELWFLLHFCYTTKEFISNNDLQNDLKKYIEGYAKNNNTYLDVKEFTKKAIENSKRLEKYQLGRGQALDSEKCNPYTGVYKVVEELINRNEK